jgi:phospho-N-acetylmuramoyl-pentapeptide-transferase
MFYWLWTHFAGSGYVPVLNLLKYETFRTGLAIFTALAVVVGLGSRFIRWMQARQGKGQPIRKEGIERHVLEKAGTPTMGGVMILSGLFAGTVLWSDLSNPYVWAVLIVTAGYGVLGFLDDYAKVTKQSTEGISGRARLVLEALIAAGAVALIVLFAAKPPTEPHLLTTVTFPFFKQLSLNLGWDTSPSPPS